MIVLLFFAASFASETQNYSYSRKRQLQEQQCLHICQSDYRVGKNKISEHAANVNVGGAPPKKELLDAVLTACRKGCTKFLKNLKDGVSLLMDNVLDGLFDVVGAGIKKASGVVTYLSTSTEDFRNKAKPHAIVLKNQADVTIEYKGFEAKHGKQFGLKNFNKKDSFTEETINNGETLAVRFANSSWSPRGVSGTAIYQYYDDKDINKMLFVDIEHMRGDGTKCCAYTSDYVSQWREEATQKRNCADDQKQWIKNTGTNTEILKDNKTSEFSSQAIDSTECKPDAGCKRIRYCTIKFFKTEDTTAGSVKITIPDKEVTEFFIHGNDIEDTKKQAPSQQDKHRPAPNQQEQRNYFQQQSYGKQRNQFQANDYDESEDDYYIDESYD